MKFYSYTNENKNYTKAVSLQNVRSIKITENSGKSAIRFGVSITYQDGSCESLPYLEKEESKKVYNEILNLLNKEELPIDK
jgi:hypothetical protein